MCTFFYFLCGPHIEIFKVYRVSFLSVKQQERVNDLWPFSIAEVKNAFENVFNPPYSLMSRCVIKYSKYLYFNLH